jgi:hypothetical protein
MTGLFQGETQLQDQPPGHGERSGRLLHWSLVAVGLVPMVLLAQWVWRYGVNVPHWDQWPMVFLFEAAAEGRLTRDDLFQQHNESRKVFPRLLFLALAQLTGWNVRYEMGVIVVLAAITSLNIYILARRTVGAAPLLRQWPWAPAALWLLANLLIFSPVQHENWLWGIQVVVFVPIALLTCGLVVTTSMSRFGVKVLLCALLAFVATFSYANGLLVWVLLGVALVGLHQDQMRRRWWIIGAYAAAFAASVWLYFHDYSRPPWHPSFRDGLSQPIDLARYFLAFLGSPLRLGFEDGNRQLSLARLAGAALVAMIVICGSYIVLRRRRDSLLRAATPWALIAAYVLISALVTAGGRVGFGKMQALESRYTSFAVYLPVALIFIGAMVLAHVADRSRSALARLSVGLLGGVLILALIVSHVLTSIPAVRDMEEEKRARLENKALLHWINIAQERGVLGHRIYPLLDELVHRANSADRLKMLDPPLARRPVPVDATEPGVLYGRFDRLDWMEDGLIAGGWAMLPHRRSPADAVLLTWQVEEGPPHVFAVVTERHQRPDVARYFYDPQFIDRGWRRLVDPQVLPETAIISAWAFDAETAMAYRLELDRPFPPQP